MLEKGLKRARDAGTRPGYDLMYELFDEKFLSQRHRENAARTED